MYDGRYGSNLTKFKTAVRNKPTNYEIYDFNETNNYVRKILRDYKIYQDLYEKDA